MGVHVCDLSLFNWSDAHQEAAWEKFCIPGRTVCDPNPDDGVITKCDQRWNENFCQNDREYTMAFRRGDKLHFQTKFRDFWNPDPEVPSGGYNDWIIVRLIKNGTNETLSEDVADFASRYWVGWNGQESIQVLEVDTQLPIFDDVECWHLEFESRRIETKGEEEEETEIIVIDSEACSEDFCDCDTCDVQPLFRAIHGQGYDGHGYYYGPVTNFVGNAFFLYNPAWRFPMEYLQIGGRVTRETSPTAVVDHDVSEVWHVGTITAVPPFVFNMVLKGILTALQVKINGKRFQIADRSITRTNNKSEMLTFTFEIYRNGKKQKTDC
jgi:hypothetical protein